MAPPLLSVSLEKVNAPFFGGAITTKSKRCSKHGKILVILPGCQFPDLLELEPDLSKAVQASDTVLVVVPSYGFAEVLQQIAPDLRPEAGVAWATKGLEPETGRLLSEVATDILGHDRALAVLSGPTFAKEMAQGMPTAIAVAANQPDFVDKLSKALHCDRSFRVYLNDDFIGMQLGGAVKNVYRNWRWYGRWPWLWSKYSHRVNHSRFGGNDAPRSSIRWKSGNLYRYGGFG